MPELRLATFNCENLMMRCDFARAGIKRARERLTEVDDATVAAQVDSVFNVLSEDDRTLTAESLGATQAEVCALQEVENLVTLTAFDTRYLARWSGGAFEERVLLEGNDTPRHRCRPAVAPAGYPLSQPCAGDLWPPRPEAAKWTERQ
jgi:hypothetical protein